MIESVVLQVLSMLVLCLLKKPVHPMDTGKGEETPVSMYATP